MAETKIADAGHRFSYACWIDGRRSAHRSAARSGSQSPDAETHCLPAPSADETVALAERPHCFRDADERPDDLQRTPAPLLGSVWRELRSSVAVVPRPANPW